MTTTPKTTRIRTTATSPASRRGFLQRAAGFAALGGGGPLALNLAALSSASAQSASGYRALVCIFLNGGNDAFNMVLPTDDASWAAYTTTRNQAPSSIALLKDVAPNPGAAASSVERLGGVLPIAPLHAQGRSFALHPAMAGAKALFDARRLAVVANVGPLIAPTTKAQYGQSGHAKPAKLFSHNDQSSTWQSFRPEGASHGWGGLMGDVLAAGNGSGATFTAVSSSGSAVWLTGRSTLPYQVSSTGPIAVGWVDPGNGVRSLHGSTLGYQALRRIMTAAPTGGAGARPLHADLATVYGRSLDAEGRLSSVLPPASMAPYGTPPTSGGYDQNKDPLLQFTHPGTGQATGSSLARQLQAIARLMAAGQAMGVRRQVFYASLGGFDTHDNQVAQHAMLMAQLSHALVYFDSVLGQLGLRDSVTTFTASEFGRTFTSNGDGTDHGWGAHHLVMGGGSLAGGDLYGRFPTYGSVRDAGSAFASSPDQLGNGVLLPSLSVDQYAYTLGRWMGVSEANALAILPNLSRFNAAERNLGFLA